MAFAGEFWIPEEEGHLNHEGYVFPGRPTDWSTNPLYTKEMEEEYGASRHMTMVFNQFVWL